jgi:spore maturation protein CgeB
MADGQTGSAIKYAFEQLGHEVDYVDAKRMPLTSYSVSCGFKPDLMFCSRTKELTEQVAQIKRKFSTAVTCMWNVDTRASIDEWSHLYPLIKLCNYYFVVDAEFIPQWKELNRNTFWLPQGLQNEVYKKPGMITDADRSKYSCDISFAGSYVNFHGEFRPPFVNAVVAAGVNFKRWGCKGTIKIYNERHNKMVSLSKINLAMSGWPNNVKYTSVRNYKILGAGGFMLEFCRERLYEIFPEDTLRCYTSPEDLVEKVHYWLDHEEERKEIAERGHAWVHANATYTHRIKTALDYMEM